MYREFIALDENPETISDQLKKYAADGWEIISAAPRGAYLDGVPDNSTIWSILLGRKAKVPANAESLTRTGAMRRK